MKIIGFGLDPNSVYSTKYRLSKYKDFFKSNGIELVVRPTLPMEKFKRLYNINKYIGHFAYYGLHMFDLFVSIVESQNYDAVIVQRHLFPGKFNWLEKLLIKYNKNIVFDFDDAIFTLPKHFQHKGWETDKNSKNEFDKINTIIKSSKLIIAGNNYLRTYAEQYNKNIIVVPTPIDIESFQKPKTTYLTNKKIKIGWYGSWSNQPYLETIIDAIKEISIKYDIELIVISDKPYFKKYKFIKNIRWNEKEEENQITDLDIAVAPLPIDEWTKGKCGYKIMKYMICGVPSIVTPIEIQKEIIDHGINGYHANDKKEWVYFIEKLIKSEKLRKEFGIKSRTKIIEKYSRENLGKIITENIKHLPH